MIGRRRLGTPQVARCGARIRSIAAGDRVQCQLQHGGKAFVVVNADGTTSIEILLDPVAGDARAETVSIEREASLLEMSRKGLGMTAIVDAAGLHDPPARKIDQVV